jgi:ABC-2 type transport system ATP-binding protein
MQLKAIEIDALQKSFGDNHILRDVSLSIDEGSVYGLIGPHAAGKSTLVHIILGLMRPTAGWLEVLGTENLERARSRIGYLPERARYHQRYAAREYLHYLGAFDGLSGAILHDRVDVALSRVGLDDVANRQIATFSRGQLQRLGLAQALLSDPALLVLDEPFGTLEPGAQNEMLALLDDLRADGRTILITTPYFPNLEQICDRIGILAGGRLVVEANAQALRQPANSVRITVDRLSPTLIAQLQQLGPSVICGERDIILRPNTQQLQATVIRTLLDAEALIIGLAPQERPLERLYLRALRGEIDEASFAVDTAPTDVAQAVGQDQPAHDSPTNERWQRPAPSPAAVSAPQPPSVEPPNVPVSEAQKPPTPVAAPRQDAYRSGEGDTLLRELLRRDRAPDDES